MPITTTLKVNPESLMQQATTIEMTVENIVAQMQIMQNVLVNSDYWKGDAADLNRIELNMHEEEISILLKRMRALPVDIRMIAGNYKAVAQGNTRRISELPIDALH